MSPQSNQHQLHQIPETNLDQLSHIASFFNHKHVLITGSTGFIGKVLVEKLLVSCNGIEKIYLPIRPSKTGKSPCQRLAEMIEQKPFNFRLKHNEIANKLEALDCDLSMKDLNLSQNDLDKLRQNVSVVFHVAASVKFEAPLNDNIEHNVVTTKQLLELSKSFKNLATFVHVSTAYSNCQLNLIEEKVYQLEVPQTKDELKRVEYKPELLDNRPNSYTFTKAMAESVVTQYANDINVAIVRPSIVMSAIREPVPGWIDNFNGPVGLSILGALGILQQIKVNSEVVFDLIPVDIVTNALLSIAWATSQQKDKFYASQHPQADNKLISTTNNTNNSSCRHHHVEQVSNKTTNEPLVFNLTTGSENPCTFYNYFSSGRHAAYQKPSCKVLRPMLEIPKQTGINPAKYFVYKVFSHLLFGYIADIILGIFGQKKLVTKAVSKMHHANDVFDYFCSNQWTFKTDNVKTLRSLQTNFDKLEFNLDVNLIDWIKYAEISWLGCRRYILKEDDSKFEAARSRYKRLCLMYYLTKVTMLIFCTLLTRYLFGLSTFASTAFLIPIYSIIYLL